MYRCVFEHHWWLENSLGCHRRGFDCIGCPKWRLFMAISPSRTLRLRWSRLWGTFPAQSRDQHAEWKEIATLSNYPDGLTCKVNPLPEYSSMHICVSVHWGFGEIGQFLMILSASSWHASTFQRWARLKHHQRSVLVVIYHVGPTNCSLITVVIFFKVRNRVKKAHFEGKELSDLQDLFLAKFQYEVCRRNNEKV